MSKKKGSGYNDTRTSCTVPGIRFASHACEHAIHTSASYGNTHNTQTQTQCTMVTRHRTTVRYFPMLVRAQKPFHFPVTFLPRSEQLPLTPRLSEQSPAQACKSASETPCGRRPPVGRFTVPFSIEEAYAGIHVLVQKVAMKDVFSIAEHLSRLAGEPSRHGLRLGRPPGPYGYMSGNGCTSTPLLLGRRCCQAQKPCVTKLGPVTSSGDVLPVVLLCARLIRKAMNGCAGGAAINALHIVSFL